MSGQEPPTDAGASGSAGAKPPKNSTKKHKQKHNKPGKNKAAKKNAKIMRVTAAKTPEDDAETGGIQQDDDYQQVEDPELREIFKQLEERKPEVVSEPANAFEAAFKDLKLAESSKAEAKAYTQEEPNGDDGQEAKALATNIKDDNPVTGDPKDDTDPMDESTETVEDKPADDASAVKVYKVKNRKRKNRKTVKSAKPAVGAEVPPSEPENAEACENKPMGSAPSYSVVVKPLEARSPTKMLHGPPGFSNYSDEDCDSGDLHDDDDNDDYYDYGGVQDNYYEF